VSPNDVTRTPTVEIDFFYLNVIITFGRDKDNMPAAEHPFFNMVDFPTMSGEIETQFLNISDRIHSLTHQIPSVLSGRKILSGVYSR
jgi:hypothetical protein